MKWSLILNDSFNGSICIDNVNNDYTTQEIFIDSKSLTYDIKVSIL